MGFDRSEYQRAMRAAPGMTRGALSHRTRIPPARLLQITTGRASPSLSERSRIAAALRVPPGRMFGGGDAE